MRNFVRLLLILTSLVAASAAMSGSACAHAALTAASPTDGAVVTTAPAELSLSFSEPVSPLVLKLIGPDGIARPLGRVTLKDKTLAIEPPAGLGQGTYVLSWRVVSEDGHPVGGSVLFSIGAPSATPAAAAQGDPATRLMLWLGRLGLYLGLALGIGGGAFAVWVAPLPAAARRPLGSLIWLGLAALPPALTAQGLDALGAPLSDALQPAVWQAAAASSFGRTTLIAALALVAGLSALRLHGRAGRALAAIALLGTGAALAASGHAGTAAPQWLMRPVVFLHALSVAGWVGALLPLAFALREPDGAAALARFSRRIPFFLAAILLSGIVLAAVQVERPEALLATGYGNILLAKLVLVAVLLGLAAVNRYRLTSRAGAAQSLAIRHLRRVIAVEIIVVLAVFGTAALWRFTPPPRALAIAATQPAMVHIHAEKAMADLSVTPGRAGPVAIAISLLDGEFGPLPAKELRLSLANPAAGIEPIERPAARQEDGSWRVAELAIPAAGRWTVELEILVSDFELTRLGGTVEIRP